jgi:hypothetical protein
MLVIPFEEIKQKQYYDADGIPIPESDLVNHPHVGHSIDRDNFIRLNFGQEYLNNCYKTHRWDISDLMHIQGYPLYSKWVGGGCCYKPKKVFNKKYFKNY